jgi:hypothetical protein
MIMKTLTKLLMALVMAAGFFGLTELAARAEPAGYVYYGQFREAATAARQAQLLNEGNDSQYDAGWAESAPDPVSQQYRVFARPKAAAQNNNNPIMTQSGQLTKNHPEDRFRLGCHAVVYTMNMTAGQRYQLDLTSPRGPSFFDTWLRIQDPQGNALANDDDSGEGLDARIVYTPTRTGVYHIVVTSYSRGPRGITP